MLELTDAVVILVVTVIAGLIFYSVLTAKSRLELKKYELNLKKTEAARRVANRGRNSIVTHTSSSEAAPEWLYDVAEELGLGEYLEQDEMPPELVKFMPMIKGFVESGGLQRIMAAGGKPGNEQSSGAAPGGSASGGEGGW